MIEKAGLMLQMTEILTIEYRKCGILSSKLIPYTGNVGFHI